MEILIKMSFVVIQTNIEDVFLKVLLVQVNKLVLVIKEKIHQKVSIFSRIIINVI